MPEIIQGKWDDLVARHDLRGRTVRVVVLDRDLDNPWLRMLQAWADSHQPVGQHRVPRILSFNDADFRRFTEIALLNPFDVLGVPRI